MKIFYRHSFHKVTPRNRWFFFCDYFPTLHLHTFVIDIISCFEIIIKYLWFGFVNDWKKPYSITLLNWAILTGQFLNLQIDRRTQSVVLFFHHLSANSLNNFSDSKFLFAQKNISSITFFTFSFLLQTQYHILLKNYHHFKNFYNFADLIIFWICALTTNQHTFSQLFKDLIIFSLSRFNNTRDSFAFQMYFQFLILNLIATKFSSSVSKMNFRYF